LSKTNDTPGRESEEAIYKEATAMKEGKKVTSATEGSYS
jgi:hypothetical protein